MYKKLLLTFLAFSLAAGVFSQNLKPVDAESKVLFVIKNMGLSVDGSLTGLAGTINFNPKNASGSSFDVTVDVNTINTDNKRRDDHLKKDDFFDAAKYPTISIKSTKIQPKGNNTFFAQAILTMHGVSKNIQFDFIATPASGGYRFKAEFAVNRLDYKIGGNSMTMGDEVAVKLDVLAKK
ncbi:YceI family protein [Niabella insulamsoli]|uniref:YceI family protein n=1 Tax=Niabella insulamsoli TaxID=3144874 RepID=UPI0031FCE285